MPRSSNDEADIILKLYELYDTSREAMLWFLQEFNSNNYKAYRARYRATSKERLYFSKVCGFFEISGVLVRRGLIKKGFFFDVFNPSPYWEKAIPVIRGMRDERPHIYENFGYLHQARTNWSKKRPPVALSEEVD